MHSTVKADSALFRSAPPDVTAAIRTASSESGVSFSYLMAKAATESGFRADAKAATSSATGLFQFIEGTWLGMVREHGDSVGLGRYAAALRRGEVDGALRREILNLRSDPGIAARMAARYACENREHLERTVGGPIGDTELYLAHFLGPAGAERFISAWRADPERPAASVCPEAARANRSIFYDAGGPRSLDAVRRHFAAKFDRCDTTPPPTPISPAAPAPIEAASPRFRPLMPTGPGAAVRALDTLTPTAYAARIFMASLSVPGETTGDATDRSRTLRSGATARPTAGTDRNI